MCSRAQNIDEIILLGGNGEDSVPVFENGPDGFKYDYRLNVGSAEQATVVVKVCSPVNSSSRDIDGGFNEECLSQSKRRKVGVDLNYQNSSHVRISCTARRDESVGIAVGEIKREEEDEEHQCFSESETKRAPALDYWTQDLNGFPVIPAFFGEPGVHVDGEDLSVASCFRLYMSDWLLIHLLEETNKYANDLKAGNDKRDKEWSCVSLLEMKGFILILIHMGMVKKNSIDDYWCQDAFLASPFAKQVLSRGRFKSIYAMFQMNDLHSHIPTSSSSHDPLYEIRPVYDYLQKRFQDVYTPYKEIAIGEAVNFDSSPSSSSSLSGQQQQLCNAYLASSPDTSCIKMYALSDCATGYVYRFELCASKSSSDNNNSKHESADRGLRLMMPLLDKGYHLYTAENCTCPVFFKTLTNRNTMCTGVVRGKRDGIPEDLLIENLPVTEQIAFRRSDKLCALKWKTCCKTSEGDLCILTSFHHPLETTASPNENTRQRKRDLSRIMPVCVDEFNKTMSSLVNQLVETMEFVPLSRQAVNWPKRVFFYLLTLCIKQAMIVYNKLQRDRGGKTLSFHLFVRTLGKQLSDEFVAEQGQPVQSLSIASLTKKPHPDIRTDHSRFHHLVNGLTSKSGKRARVRCRVCAEVVTRIVQDSHKVVRTRDNKLYYRHIGTRCQVCKVGLCVHPCFYLYHNEGDYISAGASMDHYKRLAAEFAASRS